MENMIINVKHEEDLITLDLRIKQLRYLKDINEHGEVLFMELSGDDVAGYEYLFREDVPLFFKCLSEDIKEFLGLDVQVENMGIYPYNINVAEVD